MSLSNTFLKKFLALESASGVILVLMMVLAMILVNSPFVSIYEQLTQNVVFFINEILMAIFFLLVGLELKISYVEGRLSHFSQIALPLMGALGGMLIPVFIYWFFNRGNPIALNGWATPVATDIAFALGVLSIVGSRISPSLKLFLLAVAIFDDIGAIIIIALFYSRDLSFLWIILSGITLLGLGLLNYVTLFSTLSIFIYSLLGICLWFCLFQAGIHPTVAGVLFAMTLPRGDKYNSSLYFLQEKLHPWVAFLIIPLFVLTNAGVSFKGFSFDLFTNTVVLGIIFGLFLGKQLGVFGFCWFLIRSGFAKLPSKTSWGELYGVAVLCGIGFTMSLFLGTLSFPNDDAYLSAVRFGVIIASILSGSVGLLVLLIFDQKRSSGID